MTARLDKFWVAHDHPSSEGFFVVRFRNPFVVAWVNPVGPGAGVQLVYWPADALRGRPDAAALRVMRGLAHLAAVEANDWAPADEELSWCASETPAPEWLVADNRNAGMTLVLNTRMRVAWIADEQTQQLRDVPVAVEQDDFLPLHGFPEKTLEARVYYTGFLLAEDEIEGG